MCTSIVHDFCSRMRTTRELFFSKTSSLISSAILSDFNESSSSSCLLRLVYLGVCLTENIEYQCSDSPPSLCLHASLLRDLVTSKRERELRIMWEETAQSLHASHFSKMSFLPSKRERENELVDGDEKCLLVSQVLQLEEEQMLAWVRLRGSVVVGPTNAGLLFDGIFPQSSNSASRATLIILSIFDHHFALGAQQTRYLLLGLSFLRVTNHFDLSCILLSGPTRGLWPPRTKSKCHVVF